MNKKASLNLSIQMIVIVVIAFVVLGLGLGFVRNQFSIFEETSTSVQEQIKQQILDDLRTGNKKLSFPATSMMIERGKSKDIAIGVKNTQNVNLQYSITVDVKQMQEGTIVTAEELNEQVTFFYDKDASDLTPTDARVHSIRVSTPGLKGSYLVKLSIIDNQAAEGENVYDEKTFFVTVS